MEFRRARARNSKISSYLRMVPGSTPAEPVTKPFTIALQDDRTPPWLMGAFLVLFGVTLAAAMPAIAAAARQDGAAASSQRATPERLVIRAKIAIFRALPPKTADGHDVIQVSHRLAPVAVAREPLLQRAIDAGAAIGSRGIRIRAPPALHA
jgi:hypothetical protein